MLNRMNTIFLAVGTIMALGAPVVTRAQSGDAIAKAERTCEDYGVGQGAVAADTCVARVARTYDRGELEQARVEARNIARAQRTCLASEIEPMTSGYRQCIARETGGGPEIATAPGDDRQRTQ